MDEADPIEAIGDLQVEVQALRSLVEFLLAQHVLKSDDPLKSLEIIQEKMEDSSAIVSLNADDPDQTDLSERVNEVMVDIIENAREFVHKAKRC